MKRLRASLHELDAQPKNKHTLFVGSDREAAAFKLTLTLTPTPTQTQTQTQTQTPTPTPTLTLTLTPDSGQVEEILAQVKYTVRQGL